MRLGMSIILSLTAANLGAQTNSRANGATLLTISGNLPTTLSLTAEDLSKFPHQEVTVQEHDGTKATYEGVLLLTLLEKAGAPVGKRLKGKALATYVLASAKDGYQVIFSLAELDPEIRDSDVVVADRRNGKALAENAGPLRIIAATDKKPARSIRMLTSLKWVLLQPDGNKEE